MKFGSLFAGIGGMDLGLERAGMKCVWQVEIDEFCRKVLAKHWPYVRRWDDVRTFPPEGNWSCDLIAGGFPCQDISNAGKMEGIDGERSGLWAEFARIIRVVRPRFVLVENVAALLGRGAGRVLGDFAEIGFYAEWQPIPASAAGAPHLRERVFIVASSGGLDSMPLLREPLLHDPQDARSRLPLPADRGVDCRPLLDRLPGDDTDADGERCEELDTAAVSGVVGQHPWVAAETGHNWRSEPNVGRVADGVPARVDRLRGLGNAVVPQIAEWIGRRLMEQSI
jgi:DNA (cytosine-5)-methyltransferase 1